MIISLLWGVFCYFLLSAIFSLVSSVMSANASAKRYEADAPNRERRALEAKKNKYGFEHREAITEDTLRRVYKQHPEWFKEVRFDWMKVSN